MNFLDKFQQAWQSQCNKPVDINPDQLLKVANIERHAYFWVDMLLVSFFFFDMVFMLWSAFRKDIDQNWPWVISAASSLWVLGYVVFNRWRQRRHAAQYDESVLAHVEWSIKEAEHRMWQDRFTFWWYILPIALGCMIPPAVFFAMQCGKRPLLDALIPFVMTEVVFAGVMIFVHLVMKYGQRAGLVGQRQKLAALRTLRETLLNAGEPQV
jgi:hypothetical protein